MDWLAENIGKLLKGGIDAYRNRVQEKEKEKSQKGREKIIRQLEIARQKKDRDEVRRLTLALRLLDNNEL